MDDSHGPVHVVRTGVREVGLDAQADVSRCWRPYRPTHAPSLACTQPCADYIHTHMQRLAACGLDVGRRWWPPQGAVVTMHGLVASSACFCKSSGTVSFLVSVGRQMLLYKNRLTGTIPSGINVLADLVYVSPSLTSRCHAAARWNSAGGRGSPVVALVVTSFPCFFSSSSIVSMFLFTSFAHFSFVYC